MSVLEISFFSIFLGVYGLNFYPCVEDRDKTILK